MGYIRVIMHLYTNLLLASWDIQVFVVGVYKIAWIEHFGSEQLSHLCDILGI